LLLNLVFIDDFVDAEKGFQFQIIVVERFAFIEEYLSTGTIVTGHSKSGEHILDVFRIIFHMIWAEVLSMAVGSKTIEELPPATWILALGDFEAIKATGIALEHGLWDIIDCMSVEEEARCGIFVFADFQGDEFATWSSSVINDTVDDKVCAMPSVLTRQMRNLGLIVVNETFEFICRNSEWNADFLIADGDLLTSLNRQSEIADTWWLAEKRCRCVWLSNSS
jgi:hypothetical protein